MTAVTYPKPGINFTQPEWRRYHRADTGVIGSPGGADRQVYADGSGPYIKRLPGARYIQGIYGADDDTWQGTVTSNGTAQWRVDRVVDQLGADGVITTVIVPGTAAATPAPPDLEQTEGGKWQEHLAYFRVKPGFTNITSTDATVVDERRFMPARVIPVASDAQLPANPRFGDEAIYPDGSSKRWNGSAWVPVTALPNVALFDDTGLYGATTAGQTRVSPASLGTLTLPTAARMLIRCDVSLGWDVAGSLWDIAVGARLTPVTTGTPEADYLSPYRPIRSLPPTSTAAMTARVLTPVLSAGAYQVRALMKTGPSSAPGQGVAFVCPQLTLESVGSAS